jgi:hypothetical protein
VGLGRGVASDLLLLSVRVRLEIDSVADLRSLLAVFGRFRAATEGTADIDLCIREEGASRRVVATGSGLRREVLLPDADAALDCAYATILDEVGRRSADAICIHGAALTLDGAGTILSGPSGFGKTTLALALAALGHELVSDEVSAIDRRTGKLHPFPLAVGCRDASLGLLERNGWAPAAPVLLRSRRKTWIAPSSITDQIQVRDVFVIGSEDAPPAGAPGTFRLQVDGPAAGVAADLLRIDGVRECHAEQDSGWIRLVTDRGLWLADRVEAAVVARGRVVLQVDDLDRPAASFGRSPEASRIGVGGGVATLLGQLRGFGALVGWTGQRPGAFAEVFQALATGLSGARFWRLRPGRLAETANYIHRTVAYPAPPA